MIPLVCFSIIKNNRQLFSPTVIVARVSPHKPSPKVEAIRYA